MAEIEVLLFRQIDEKSLDLAEIIIIYNNVKQFIILFYAAKIRSEFIQNYCMICMLEFSRNFDVGVSPKKDEARFETFYVTKTTLALFTLQKQTIFPLHYTS